MDIVGSVVQAYANCDFAAALEQQKAGTSEIPKWIQLDVDAQLQSDNHNNCGVLSLISFFRAIRKLNEPGRTEVTAANLAAQWKCVMHSKNVGKICSNSLPRVMILPRLTTFKSFSKILLAVEKRYSSGARKKLGV